LTTALNTVFFERFAALPSAANLAGETPAAALHAPQLPNWHSTLEIVKSS
jgi:hypothetical protein